MWEISQIIDFIITIYIGIMGIFFNKWSVSFTKKSFDYLYVKTNLSLFKKMADESAKPYMRILFFGAGVLGFILAGCFIAQNIFGINLPIIWN